MRKFKNLIYVFLVCVTFLGLLPPNIVYAGGIGNTDDTEVVNYDSITNKIQFQIVAKTATTSTRYRTIGWTISISGIKIIYKYPEIAHFDFAFYLRDIIEEYERQYGESSSQYKTVYNAMFTTGGTITFDAIQTVVVNGVAKGYIVDNPIYTKSDSYNYGGKVYRTLSGIQSAASWGSTTKNVDLPKYFGISFTFAKQTPKTGSITVNLTRGSGVTESISNKQFAIYDESGAQVAVQKTTSTGTLSFSGLQFKKYTIRALTNVSNTTFTYASRSKYVTLTANNPNQTVAFQINKGTGYIYVHLKRGTGVTSDSEIQNRSFGIYNSDGDLVTTIKTSVSTGTNQYGNLSSSLPAGTYTVKPLDRQSGYSYSSNAMTITVAASSSPDVVFTLNKLTGTIWPMVNLVDVGDSVVTEGNTGIKVELWDENGSLLKDYTYDRLPITSTGHNQLYASFTSLSYGKYILKYKNIPDDHYLESNEIAVTLSSKEVYVYNTLRKLDRKSRIYVSAYNDSDVTESIVGRKFGVYSTSGTLIKQGTTNASGHLILDDLNEGTYIVKQINIPTNHYSVPNEQIVTLEKGDTAYVDFTLCKYVSNLIIRLTSEDGASISNKEFVITDPLGNEKLYYTNSSGKITVNNIVSGNYKVEESPIEDYIVPDPVNFYLPSNSTATIDFYNVLQYKLKTEIISVPSEITAGDTFDVVVRYTNSGGKTTPVSSTYSQFSVSGNITLISEPNPYFSVPARSSVTKTYTLYANSEGTAKLMAEINPTRVLNEDTYADNKAEKTINIEKKLDTNLKIEYITPNAAYKLGTDVIVSFMVYNEGTKDIIPSDNLSVKLQSDKRDSAGYVSFSNQTVNNVVIPAGGSNLVYFKVAIPESISNLTNGLRFTATINSGNTVAEVNYTDNQTIVLRNAENIIQSQTPDTQYEDKKPAGWYKPTASTPSASSSTWSVWEYINNGFVKKTYTANIVGTPTITPDPNATSSIYKNGRWTMRSGYGFSIVYTPSIKFQNDIAPTSSAYTAIQNANCYFPEFSYSGAVNKFRTLEKINNGFSFAVNSQGKNARLHFTPLWFPNGDYTVSILSQDCWTPAGMLHSTANTSLTIDGNVYDDWYIANK